jgi:hypothetical protein
MEINLQKVEDETKEWLENFVDIPRQELNGFALCPYAKQARLKNKITFRIGGHPYTDLVEHAVNGNDGYDVFMYVYNPDDWNKDAFHEMVYKGNDDHLAQVDLISLPDHPHEVEKINGVLCNQGTYAYSMITAISALDNASAKLHKAGYYNAWKDSDEYMHGLFRGRNDPRNNT